MARGAHRSMPMAKPATYNGPTVSSSMYKACYTAQTDKFLCFFKSFFSFVLRIERQVRSKDKTVINRNNQLLADYSIISKDSNIEPQHEANGWRVTQLKFNSASSEGLDRLGLHNRDQGGALRWRLSRATFTTNVLLCTGKSTSRWMR